MNRAIWVRSSLLFRQCLVIIRCLWYIRESARLYGRPRLPLPAIKDPPLPWASVHWLVQCKLECHWKTQCTLGYHWATKRILAGYTGTPLEKLSWNSPTLECHWRNLVESGPHWDATGETLTFAAYTGTPLEGLWQLTHAPTHTVKHAE